MNSKTRTMANEIQTKLKTSITGANEFPNVDAVIDYAVKRLYDDLKRQKAI